MRLAILSQDLSQPGNGVRSVVGFLHRVASEAGFAVDLLSASTSSRDPASVLLHAPRSWLRGPRVIERPEPPLPHVHYGARLGELEFQRYRPRQELTRRLERSDLVQVVAGTPVWANLARHARVPVALQVASLSRLERESALATERGLRRIWTAAMTTVNSGGEVRALRRADLVQVENRILAARLEQGPAAGRIVLAPPGVDVERFRPASGSVDGYWLSVARFADPRKNAALLFRAYAAAKALRPGLPRLVLAGSSGPTDADLELARRLGIGADLELRGAIAEAELPALYQGAALFLLASNEEGWGLVLVEAMASGLPVVATRTHGAAEIVRDGETGFLVPTGDSAALAARAVELFDRPEVARRWGDAGRALAQRDYSHEACGRRFVDGWKSLLERGPRRFGAGAGPEVGATEGP